MVLDNVKHSAADGPLGDIAYLVRSDHRVSVLVVLSDCPQGRDELCERTDVSSSTIRRTLGEFEKRSWVCKNGHQYEATQLGSFIAEAMQVLIDRVETERKLRDVWHWLPEEFGELSVETWPDLRVTVAEPDFPYRPINRFESLLQGTTRFRCLRPEVSLMEPCFGLLFQLLDDEANITLIDRRACHAYFLSTYPERSAEMIQRDTFTALEHDRLPSHGIGLLDDRVTISCFEKGSGTVRALIDTDSQEVREWAESIYASYRADARPIDSQQIVG
ncbi:Transcriptional regulator, contains HTH domain [Halalkaliarchaeum sp. AArc-CO]|uniref:helix-turn-helix transcriptional regulator n=1 Tax=Halalkaliarchaeum sp. AArc-CO TaxID=2866381 RepID=UPI00217D88F9|nr:MarR family transcriptional regulator [Halalkaliarchaeum sp. AArc-CO]UWG50443.1 Transcriptional regulator, contains HTH domain [Halalkaliarchaeum sp. AArc-CO]